MGAARVEGKAAKVIPALVAIVGLAATYIAYAPGVVSPDATDQFHQAVTGHFVDTHPPIMAWLWSKTNAIIPGPGGFFLLLIVLYWGGFFLIIRHLLDIGTGRALIACVLPFSPILFNFAGTIWKDVLASGCFLVATGIILSRRPGETTRFPLMPSLIVVILLLVGALARWNSVPGVIPLLVLALWPQAPAQTPLLRTVMRLALCTPIVLAVWATTGKLLDATIIHAEQTGFANMLPLWDLVGMSHRLGENLLPGPWTPQQAAQIMSCYDPIDDDGLLPGTPCNFIARTLTQNDHWHASVLFPLWAKTIVRHPNTYIDTRLAYVRALFWPNVVFLFDADDGIGPFNHHSGFLFELEKRILWFCRNAPGLHFVFTVGFWMIASAVLTAAFAIALWRGWTGCYPSFLISLSAGVNLWPLVIIGPDGQLRFANWAIAALSIAILIARRRMDPAPSVMAPPSPYASAR